MAAKAVKRKIKKKSKKTRRKAAAPSIVLDYPREGEKIRAGHYAVRIAAGPGKKVEISFNDGKDWQLCRQAIGYYWFDWNPTEPGSYTLIARTRNVSRRAVRSEARRFTVI